MRLKFLLCLIFALSFPLFAEVTMDEAMLAEIKAMKEERYGPSFYGIEIPETGARVLLIVDASKSMHRKDALRLDGGSRWDTLVDEVDSMTTQMQTLIKANPSLCFTVTLLYEVGGKPHMGTMPYDITQPVGKTLLMKELRSKTFGNGGNFETTFCETLWPLVAKQHITHIFFLGDNDIATYATTIEPVFNQWFEVKSKRPTEANLQKLWKLKCAWWEPWKRWRPPSKRKSLSFKNSTSIPLPPPPKEVVFSAVVIGQSSPLLERFTQVANGTYIERKKKKKKSTKE